MSEINRTHLFGKMNSLLYKAAENATIYCKNRGNPYVELVHWFHQVLQLQDSDLHRIQSHFQVEISRLVSDITQCLDRLPRGATSISDFSFHLEEAIERGWVYGTLLFGDSVVRSGYLIVGILKTRALHNVLINISGEYEKLKVDELTDQFSHIVAGSPEDAMLACGGTRFGGTAAPGEEVCAIPPAEMGKQEALQRFSVDLTERARAGEIDPIVGRDEEIRQIIDILMRRRQNNPILTGEAGVGKTAVVEGFAQRIANGDVPPPLQDVCLRTLDIGLLQAGASMKGEFENRLRQVIDEVQASPTPIILFIDEAHTLIGAGGAAGTGDAANLLKPALARGTLRTIAATTWSEYKKHIEKDPALTRRFQVIQVDEPTEDKAILMMRGVVSTLENHHGVQILDEALEAAVKLSHRYIPARQLPDKSVSLLDTASARGAVSQYGIPAEVEDSRRNIEYLENELRIVHREQSVGIDADERIAGIEAAITEERARLSGLEQRWESEKTLTDRILELRRLLRGDAGPDGNSPDVESSTSVEAEEPPEPIVQTKSVIVQQQQWLVELNQLQQELADLQGEHPMITPDINAQTVASVVADWTGIPVGRMVKNEVTRVLSLADTLEMRVLGQRPALEALTKRIQTSRAGLDNPSRPVGVFLLVGPSGVGKTETALALAEAMYGGEQNLISINMSEFQEAHTVSTLKGAPPGYVGYGEGGVLTEAVRRKPYSVVLLDEVEKAHHDVHEIFFQVFDKGCMEDGEGRRIDFKNTIILLTSNVGSDLIMNMCKDPDLLPEPQGLVDGLRETLLKSFPAALLGRLVVVPYYPISDEVLKLIIRLQFDRIVCRIRENHSADLTYDDAVIQLVADRCTEVESGARMVDAILTHTILPEISHAILNRMLDDGAIRSIHIGTENDDLMYVFDESQ